MPPTTQKFSSRPPKVTPSRLAAKQTFGWAVRLQACEKEHPHQRATGRQAIRVIIIFSRLHFIRHAGYCVDATIICRQANGYQGIEWCKWALKPFYHIGVGDKSSRAKTVNITIELTSHVLPQIKDNSVQDLVSISIKASPRKKRAKASGSLSISLPPLKVTTTGVMTVQAKVQANK